MRLCTFCCWNFHWCDLSNIFSSQDNVQTTQVHQKLLQPTVITLSITLTEVKWLQGTHLQKTTT